MGTVESAFLLSFFRTGLGQLLLEHHSRGAAGRNRPLNITSLMKEKIPLPSLPVQQQITALVRREADVREAVAGLVLLLNEFRSRLIADVVTGKLDVREAAARLPEEAAQPEAIEESEAETDMEEDETEDAPEEVEAS